MANDLYTLPVAHERCLDAYFREINHFQLLSQEQEAEVAQLVSEGDEDALQTLVTSNLRFVVSVAKQYAGRGILLSDLINEGNLGMLKAADRFDVERGYRFISYAVWWIRQSIIQALKDKSRIVRLPQSQTALLMRIRRAQDELQNEGVVNPGSDQVAERLDVPVAKVRIVMRADQKMIPLDASGEENDQRPLTETLSASTQPLPDNRLDEESLTIDLENLLARLTEREADVLKRYFGLGRETAQTLQQIGDDIGLTRERIRQIKEKALEKLRQTPHSGQFDDRRKAS
jgi:RNA polymerase primary sigma factor